MTCTRNTNENLVGPSTGADNVEFETGFDHFTLKNVYIGRGGGIWQITLINPYFVQQ
jgi:hypothetical protein